MFLGLAVVDTPQWGLSRAHGFSFSLSSILSRLGLYSQLMSLLFNYCCTSSPALRPGSAKSSTSAFGHPQKANTKPENLLRIQNFWLLPSDNPHPTEPPSGIMRKCVPGSPPLSIISSSFIPREKQKNGAFIPWLYSSGLSSASSNSFGFLNNSLYFERHLNTKLLPAGMPWACGECDIVSKSLEHRSYNPSPQSSFRINLEREVNSYCWLWAQSREHLRWFILAGRCVSVEHHWIIVN